MDRTFAVLGSGNGGRAFCGQIAAKGYSVTLYEPLEETDDYKKLTNDPQIFLQGDIEAGGKLHLVTMDIEAAVASSDVVFVVVPAFAHNSIFERMIPRLRDGQIVVIVPGNYGCFKLKKMMREAGVNKNITIAETSSLPYACRISSYGVVTIHKRKRYLKLAASPVKDAQSVLDIMNDIFDGYVQFIPAKNVLETDLDNLNYVMHPLPVLLNYGEIEKRPETFRHYMDGLTPIISEKMMQMDQERLATGQFYGVDLMPCLDQLKLFYGNNDAQGFYDFINSPECPYRDIVGHYVKSRYLTEDIPCVLVPGMQLANKAGIEIPYTELSVRLASELHDTDYVANGTNLEKLGIADCSKEEILELVK